MPRPSPTKTAPIPDCSGEWDPFVGWYPCSVLQPPHHVDDGAKVRELMTSMANRWSQRPLLAAWDGEPFDTLRLLTGSHRYEAARRLRMDVPVVVVDLIEAMDAKEPIKDAIQRLCEERLAAAALALLERDYF